MKKTRCVILLSMLIGSYANAATYNYTGNNYTQEVGDAYTLAMRITGTITTSVPIPPDSVNGDISGILTCYSFIDGVQTIDNTNGVFRIVTVPTLPQWALILLTILPGMVAIAGHRKRAS